MRIGRDRDRSDKTQAMLVKELHAAGMFLHRLVKADMTIGKWLAAEEVAQLLRADGLDVARCPAVGLVVLLRCCKRFGDDGGIAPCSVELYEAVVAVNDVKRPSQFGQERDCWSPFRSERPARPAAQEVACRL